ncbi:MAG: hypothetical protein JW840_07335 [Candidatus Thermoplasmatota archaeon]|nr:hypothetical protein [Candidatus Thermoplasmatota archaeon]
MIVVFGAQGIIKDVEAFIRQVLQFSNEERVVLQVMDATMVYSKDHLLSATLHATRACEKGTNATGTLGLEILLYAAGERQIDKAIQKMGVKKGKQKIAVVLTDMLGQNTKGNRAERIRKIFLTTFHLTADDSVLAGDKQTLKRFGITEKELSTIPEDRYGDLILEKVAFVDIMKK